MATRIEQNQCQKSVVNPKFLEQKPGTRAMGDAIYIQCQSMSRARTYARSKGVEGIPRFPKICAPDLIVAWSFSEISHFISDPALHANDRPKIRGLLAAVRLLLFLYTPLPQGSSWLCDADQFRRQSSVDICRTHLRLTAGANRSSDIH
jgi:hypothetical protein